MVVAEQKGRDTKQKLYRNFGMPKPEGYRKALRVMQMAAKFGRPIVTLLDTPGAYPGIDAEERGQAEAIARNLREMARLPVPVIVVCIGEGGSGGALALGVGNIVLMLENAVYSVISPESCAAIIYRDSAKAEQAAAALRLTAEDLQGLGLIDGIIPEPAGGAHEDPDAAAEFLRQTPARALDELAHLTADQIGRAPLRQVPPDGELLRVKKTVWLGDRLRALVLLATSWFPRHFRASASRVEVCMVFNGQRDCRTAAAADRQEAQRTAITNACAQLSQRRHRVESMREHPAGIGHLAE